MSEGCFFLDKNIPIPISCRYPLKKSSAGLVVHMFKRQTIFLLKRHQVECNLVRVSLKHMDFPWPLSGISPWDLETLGMVAFWGSSGITIRKPGRGPAREWACCLTYDCGVSRGWDCYELIDFRVTHWTVSRLHITLGRSSSPGSWAAAKASSRESPWNLLLMLMQPPVWSSIQYDYCSAFQGASKWLVLKCVQDLDGESSLPTTVVNSGGMCRQCPGEGRAENGWDRYRSLVPNWHLWKGLGPNIFLKALCI